MMDFILAIPEEIGWSIVGATATILVIVIIKGIKGAIEMYREYHESTDELETIDE